MNHSLIFFFCLLIAAILLAETTQQVHGADYSKFLLLRVKVSSKDELKQLVSALPNERADMVDIWSNDGQLVIGANNDIMLERRDAAQLMYTLNKFDGRSPSVQILSHNVQFLLQESKRKVPQSSDDYFQDYRDYDATMNYLEAIQKKHSKTSSLFTVGQSWEGRNIVALKISTARPGVSRPTAFFDSMQHAREWIGVPVTMYAITEILQGLEHKNETIADLLNKIDIVFIPIMNPDGFQYTHNHDRLWRKNRRNNGDGTFGVDMNRNWPIGYGIGASNSTSSIVYNGPYPLSEPENAAVYNYLRSFLGSIKAAVDFHSYSQLVLRPYGYKSDVSPDESELKALGDSMHKAILEVNNVKYDSIRGVDLYPAGGGLDDSFYANHKIAGYTIELRDTGHYGFLLPADQIIPTAKENYEAILTMCRWVADGGQVKGE